MQILVTVSADDGTGLDGAFCDVICRYRDDGADFHDIAGILAGLTTT